MWNAGGGGFGGDFDESHQDAPGGFMGSPYVGSAKKERRSQNIVSTTVREILEFSGDNLSIDGTEVHMVSVVGIVRSVDVGSARIAYTIDDHTGLLDVIRYPDNESEEESEPNALSEGVYARIVGPVRNQQGKRIVIGFKVAQIEDHNQLTTHILEVLHQRFKFSQFKLAKQDTITGTPVLANSSLMNLSNVLDKSSGSISDSDLVHNVIKTCKAQEGMMRAYIKNVLKDRLTSKRIDDVLEELISSGSIYTTSDDDSFLSVEC